MIRNTFLFTLKAQDGKPGSTVHASLVRTRVPGDGSTLEELASEASADLRKAVSDALEVGVFAVHIDVGRFVKASTELSALSLEPEEIRAKLKAAGFHEQGAPNPAK